MKVGFIGLGKLGLPCAEAIAEHYEVVGYDIYPRESVSVKIVTDIKQAVAEQDIIFVAVQTPHDPVYGGEKPISHLKNVDFDYSTVQSVLQTINSVATDNQLIVLISTVLPGTTRNKLRSCITNARFVYNPYLIAMGSVAWDMVNPEMVIIGTQDGSVTGDAAKLIEFYRPIMQNNPRYEVGTWDEAECIKVFYNTFISAKIGLVNMILDVAMKQGNINVDVVTEALAKSTMRITGPKYMTAGMGDAGPCHPRDNIALRYMAENLNLGYDLFDSIIHAREIQAANLAQFIYKIHLETDLPIYIHGRAYKPGVPYTEGSYSLLIGHYLKNKGIDVKYIDPLTGDTVAGPVTGIVLLAHNKAITYDYTKQDQSQELYCELTDNSIVIDPWRQFTTENKNIKVIHYGNTRV